MQTRHNLVFNPLFFNYGRTTSEAMTTINPTSQTLIWYYDPISPYAYLQSTQLGDIAAHPSVERIQCIPILFAGLLKHWGQLGPAEIVPKRQWTFEQVAFQAHQHNIPIVMPPMHPFNPLPLLRLAAYLQLAGDTSIGTAQRLFRFVWREGFLPQNESALNALCMEFNASAASINDPTVKAQLQANGEQALAQQVFGGPTMIVGNQKFWGFDAKTMLISYLQNDKFWTSALHKAGLELPNGMHRNQIKS